MKLKKYIEEKFFKTKIVLFPQKRGNKLDIKQKKCYNRITEKL